MGGGNWYSRISTGQRRLNSWHLKLVTPQRHMAPQDQIRPAPADKHPSDLALRHV